MFFWNFRQFKPVNFFHFFIQPACKSWIQNHRQASPQGVVVCKSWIQKRVSSSASPQRAVVCKSWIQNHRQFFSISSRCRLSISIKPQSSSSKGWLWSLRNINFGTIYDDLKTEWYFPTRRLSIDARSNIVWNTLLLEDTHFPTLSFSVLPIFG